MLRLLIINITCNQGSTGKISEQVGLMMKVEGWDVTYAHGARRVNTSKLKTLPFSSIKSEYFHALKSLLFDADGLGSTNTTKKLVDHIKKLQPDVIHIHNIHGYYLNYKVLFQYLNSTNIPIILTLHDCWNFTGHCTHFVTAKCEKWQTECYNCPLLGVSPKSLIDRSKRNFTLKRSLFTANKNLYIVPVSYWLEKITKKSFLKNKFIQVIPNGIDLNIFKPYNKEKSDKFQILGVSNVWNKDKGIFDIYKLRNLLSINDYDIILVGLSNKQIKGLPQGIIGIERTANQQELAKIYSYANVLINPTYADTFPTINLESMACGTPVITYKTGGSPESISASTGIVVEQGDIKGLYEAIIRIKNNSDKTKFTPEVCRKHAEQNFDKDKCFKEYNKLFKSVVKES